MQKRFDITISPWICKIANVLVSFQVERLIRTIKSRLWRYFSSTKRFRWLDALPDIIKAYNESRHSSHGFAPAHIKKRDYDEVLGNLYMKFALEQPKTPKYSIGDSVRISLKKLIFQKSYESTYSDEIFVVDAIHTTFPVISYKLKDAAGRILDGTYVEGEIVAATPQDAA